MGTFEPGVWTLSDSLFCRIFWVNFGFVCHRPQVGLQTQANRAVGFPLSFPTKFAIFTDNAVPQCGVLTLPSGSSPTVKPLVPKDPPPPPPPAALHAGDGEGRGSSSRQNTQCSFLRLSSFSTNRCCSIFLFTCLWSTSRALKRLVFDTFALFCGCPALCQKHPDMTEAFSPGHSLASSLDPPS